MTGTVLLPTDTVSLSVPDTADPHGWELPPDAPAYWTGPASIQMAFGTASSGADSGGGSGPFKPRTAIAGTGFLPADSQPREGMVATTSDGRRYLLGICRWVPDPIGGPLGCWTVNLSNVGQVLDGAGQVI